jgi:hypothetical protein
LWGTGTDTLFDLVNNDPPEFAEFDQRHRVLHELPPGLPLSWLVWIQPYQGQSPLVARAGGSAPIPPWLGDSPDSAWLLPRVTEVPTSPPTPITRFTYSTSFDTFGVDPSTVWITGRWATDNAGLDILLNGLSTGLSNTAQPSTWTPFAIASGVVNGSNTLDFVVANDSAATGLRVELAATGDPCVSYPTYASFPAGSSLHLLGSAAPVAGVLQLTPSDFGKAGAAWHACRHPVNKGFVTDIEFQIRDLQGGGADGLVYVIQSHSPYWVGGTGGGMGYDGLPQSVAVELDTWYNGPEAGDANGSHVAIHAGQRSNGPRAETLLAYASAPTLDNGSPHTLRVVYDGGLLEVYLDDFSRPLTHAIVHLPDVLANADGMAWSGFTAATGGADESHEVLSWRTSPMSISPVEVGQLGGGVHLKWSGWRTVLECAPTPNGPWAALPGAVTDDQFRFEYHVTPLSTPRITARFYRIRRWDAIGSSP